MALTKNQETKLTVIENFIDWYHSDDDARADMKKQAALYVQEDHADEIGQAGMSDEQRKVITHAYLDLLGSMMSPQDHDYEGQKETIAEIEQVFSFVK